MTLPRLEPNRGPGKLIVFEGVARAGKSTAIAALVEALEKAGRPPVVSSWNSVPEINSLILARKRNMSYTPLTWSLLHLADFALRYEEVVRPALAQGRPVIADRYIFTALARDVLRGLEEDYVAACFSFAARPDLVFYLHVPPEVSLARHRATTGALYPHSSGLDLWPDLPLEEGYLRYQAELHRLYSRMAAEYGMRLVDGTQPPGVVGRTVVDTVASCLGLIHGENWEDRVGGVIER